MILAAERVLVLVLIFAACWAIPGIKAQDTVDTPGSETLRCTHWLKAVVPESMHEVDPAKYCSGLSHAASWGVTTKCPRIPGSVGAATDLYCSTVGLTGNYETFAAGFRSTSTNGGTYLDGPVPTGDEENQGTAILFTKTGLWLGDLKVPAGMYALRASKSPGGWRLAIGKLAGEWNASDDSQQRLGTVEMKMGNVYAPRQEIPRIPEGKLAIEIMAPLRKPGEAFPRSEIGDRELHFIFGGTDAFVRLHPDDVPAEATAQN